MDDKEDVRKTTNNLCGTWINGLLLRTQPQRKLKNEKELMMVRLVYKLPESI